MKCFRRRICWTEEDKLASAVDSVERCGVQSDRAFYASLLRRCTYEKALEDGKRLHAIISRHGFDHDVFLCNLLVQMYGNCGSVGLACETFERIFHKNIFSWNIMMAEYARNGHLEDARASFDKMPVLNAVSYTTIITAYAQNHLVESARIVFERMADRIVPAWNAIMGAYVQNGNLKECLKLFDLMRQEGVLPNKITFIIIMDACGAAGCLQRANSIHGSAVESGYMQDSTVARLVIVMFGKCGSIGNAKFIYDNLPSKDILFGNAMIVAFTKSGNLLEAQSIFDSMANVDVVSYTALVSGYAQDGYVSNARSLFDKMPNKDLIAWNTMLSAYAQSGGLQVTKLFFDSMEERDVVSWNLLLGAYVQNGQPTEALALYLSMDSAADKVTYLSVLEACSQIGALDDGKTIHGRISGTELLKDEMVCNALIHMYAKCRSLEDAEQVLKQMSDRDGTAMIAAYAECGRVEEAKLIFDEVRTKKRVSWNSMISAYAHNGKGRDAIRCYRTMLMEGTKPCRITFIAVLSACTINSALLEGRQVHAIVRSSGYESDVGIGSALVNLYAKCGKILDARSLFDRMPTLNAATWTAMIAAYAEGGSKKIHELLQLIYRMILEGEVPDEITFVSVLSVCNHAGLLRYGLKFFNSMISDYGVLPLIDHYICIIDLLGRAGLVMLAEELIENMPFVPDVITWTMLLAACRLHNDKERGQRAAKYAIQLDPKNAAAYKS